MDLKDTTFLILIRMDSVNRLENVIAVTNALCTDFDTNIVVLEAARYNNGILKSILHKGVTYQYIEDKDPILYKTKYFNMLAGQVSTPILAIWDADVVPDTPAIIEIVGQLRSGVADAGFPYDGRCLDVPDILRSLYLQNGDIKTLYRNVNKMDLLYGHSVVGGAVFVCREEYQKIGMENEIHYGWGNDDFDRYYRFLNYGLRIAQSNNFLFHLSHPRGINSRYCSELKKWVSVRELRKTKNKMK